MFVAVILLVVSLAPAQSNQPARRLESIPFTDVRIQDSFWSRRLETNRRETLSHLLDMCEREGRLRNYLRAAGQLDGPFEGTRRHDADLYKVIEAVAYSYATHPDANLKRRAEAAVDAIVSAQQPDGYLDTYGTVGRPPGQPRREPDLFAAGHLFDAAVAWRESTGSTRLLEVAQRLANRLMHPPPAAKKAGAPGHPRIEAGLYRLFECTNDRRYLDMALGYLDARGVVAENAAADARHYQNHLPLRKQATAEGHVICSLFLCEAMQDVGLSRPDPALTEASRKIYEDAITRRLYLTGGMGRATDERYTDPWQLDNRSSIGEGCQSAALSRLALRLLLVEGDARHADIFERVLYNNLLAGVGLDGKSFFYHNRLSVRRKEATGDPYVYPLVETTRERLPRYALARQPWFKVPCCPPNVAMTLATLGQWIYARSANDALYVNLYIGSRVETVMADSKVTLTQRTNYPHDGKVEISVDASAPVEFTLALRIPDWCRKLESMRGLYSPLHSAATPPVVVRVNGVVAKSEELSRGFLLLRRSWQSGDSVAVEFPMPIVRVVADSRVTANAGRVALQRGPVVYCFESADVRVPIDDLRLGREARIEAKFVPHLLGGVTVLNIRAEEFIARTPRDAAASMTAIPYNVWCNRQPGDMDVWVAQ